ncbi:MAG TPA: serine/threonine-protein kinase [Polyangiaceae bacterium]|jgi:serine/threonine-protein kinase
MRAGRLVLLLLAVVLLAACGGGEPERPLMLPSWTLEAHGQTTPLSLPAHFDGLLGDRPARYTLRTRAELPPGMRDRDLALTIPYFAALTSLRVDGRDLLDLDSGQLDRYRGTGAHRFVVPAAATRGGDLALELTVEHRWTQSAWLDTVPRLSADPAGDSGYVFVKLFDQGSAAAGLAMLLLVGFANGIVFLADRRRTAYGWFTVASFTGAVYPAFSLGITQPVFGGYDSLVMGGAVLLSALTTMRFTSGVFGLPHPRAYWLIFLLWLAVAIWNPGPFRSTRYLSPITIFTTVLAGFYCVNLLVHELRQGRRPPLANVLATIGWPVVCIAACDDFASWLGAGELYHGVRGASLGTALLSLLQAAALGSQLMASLRRSDALNTELEGRVEALQRTNAEVQTLNDELRRQIGNRSQQLAETLANVGSLHLPALKLEAGTLVEGRYRVVRFVGSGGMAWVYEVTRETDGRRLALKLLHGRSSGAALSRFAREAKLASEVSHPGIVGVVDVDLTGEGVLFLVMEYVDGKSLEQYLDDDPAMAWSLTVLRQIAEGLAEVHARGIVHRDLKPANVLVEETLSGPIGKIADFGVSMLLAEAAARLSRPPGEEAVADARVTGAGRVMGTPTYMAPELAREGAAVHASIDLYAFGVMAHELLVGRPPFRDPLFVRAVHGRSLPPPTPLAMARPRLDRRFAELVDRCLSLDPQARPTAQEAARVLKEVRLDVEPTSVPSVRAQPRP